MALQRKTTNLTQWQKYNTTLSMPHPWQSVALKDLQLTEYDSLLTSLAKLHYTQQRVGRLTELGEEKVTAYWVGEFMKSDPMQDEERYLYLLTAHTNVLQKDSSKVYCELPPQVYRLYSGQPLQEIQINDTEVIALEKMSWAGLPFLDYYDVPELHLPISTPVTEYEESVDSLHNIFQSLYTEGYRYRREVVMVEEDYTYKGRHFLTDYEVSSEYLSHNPYQLTLEFMHPETYSRKVVVISSGKIEVYLCNARWGADLSYHHGFSFHDRLLDIRHFSDDPETKDAFCEEEVFPEPLLLGLLEEHHLIDRDQIIISRHMENREFSHWFSGCLLDFCYWYGPEDYAVDEQYSALSLEEIVATNSEKVARCRRIFHYLRYSLAVIRTMHEGKTTVEIYTNDTKERAFFLIYDEYNYFVQFVDKYMDVNGALTF